MKSSLSYFDGTLTKSHTAREGAVLDASRDWFADKTILEKILHNGSGVRFIEKSAVIDAIAQNIEHNKVKI